MTAGGFDSVLGAHRGAHRSHTVDGATLLRIGGIPALLVALADHPRPAERPLRQELLALVAGQAAADAEEENAQTFPGFCVRLGLPMESFDEVARTLTPAVSGALEERFAADVAGNRIPDEARLAALAELLWRRLSVAHLARVVVSHFGEVCEDVLGTPPAKCPDADAVGRVLWECLDSNQHGDPVIDSLSGDGYAMWAEELSQLAGLSG